MVCIDKRKNVISRDHHGAFLVPHFIINEKDLSQHILKHNWLGTDYAKDKDVIQKASFAFDE